MMQGPPPKSGGGMDFAYHTTSSHANDISFGLDSIYYLDLFNMSGVSDRTKKRKHARSVTDPEALRRAVDLQVMESLSVQDLQSNFDLFTDGLYQNNSLGLLDNLNLSKPWTTTTTTTINYNDDEQQMNDGSNNNNNNNLTTTANVTNNEGDRSSSHNFEAAMKRKSRMQKMRRRLSHRRTGSDNEQIRRAFQKGTSKTSNAGAGKKNSSNSPKRKSNTSSTKKGGGSTTTTTTTTTPTSAEQLMNPVMSESTSWKSTNNGASVDKLYSPIPFQFDLEMLRSSSAPTAMLNAPSQSSKLGSSRGKYKCSRCGQAKEGHLCPIVEARSIHTQCDLLITGCPAYFQKSTFNFNNTTMRGGQQKEQVAAM